MKNAIILFFISLIIISCRNNLPIQNNAEQLLTKLSPTDSIIQKFAPIINGDWVPTDYIENLKKTLSPYKSHIKNREEEGVYIKSTNISGDSLLIILSYGPGGPEGFITYFKKGNAPNSIIMTDVSGIDTSTINLGYKITKQDTILVLYRYNRAGTKIVFQREYNRALIKLKGGDTTNIDGLDYFQNKLLIAGKYIMIDSSGREYNIEFDNQGKVSGFKNFKYYHIENDFGQGPGTDTDLINLNTSPYIFHVNKDTLTLFDYYFNDSLGIYNNVTVAYKFIRQK
jgi:hypothetical protein